MNNIAITDATNLILILMISIPIYFFAKEPKQNNLEINLWKHIIHV